MRLRIEVREDTLAAGADLRAKTANNPAICERKI
jgi:hypothetical protein